MKKGGLFDGAGSESSGEWDESKHPRDEDGRFAVNGAGEGQSQISDSEGLTIPFQGGTINVHEKLPAVTPEQADEAKRRLKENGLPQSGFMAIVDAADKAGYATFDLKTGKPVTFTDGYCVSFQVNQAVNVHRDYTPEEYDLYVYECMIRTGSLPYLGCYGNAEISFNVTSKKLAKRMMEDYNQASYYDVSRDTVFINAKRKKKYNPTEDDS